MYLWMSPETGLRVKRADKQGWRGTSREECIISTGTEYCVRIRIAKGAGRNTRKTSTQSCNRAMQRCTFWECVLHLRLGVWQELKLPGGHGSEIQHSSGVSP